MIELVDRVALAAHKNPPEGQNCKEKLEDVARNILKQIYENQSVYYLIFKETPVLSSLVSENLAKWRRESFIQVQNVIAKAIEDGEINPKMDIEKAAFAFQALVGQRAGDILLTGETVAIDRESEKLIDILWFGLAERA